MCAVATTECLLRPATSADLEVVLGWIGSRAQAQTWGLPAAGFPAGADWIWRAIRGDAGGTMPEAAQWLLDRDRLQFLGG